jgi:uncharacterized membrane protein YidH (DUF202 family)
MAASSVNVFTADGQHLMADDTNGPRAQREDLPLSKAAEFLLDECRMVLPGIQTLFGFQLIAVFNPAFSQKLEPDDRLLHLLAIALVAVAIALIMTPAAYHRQTRPKEVTEGFIRLSTRVMLLSMLPLCVGICIDFYLIAKTIIGSGRAGLLAGALFAFFAVLWFVLPRWRALRRGTSKRR